MSAPAGVGARGASAFTAFLAAAVGLLMAMGCSFAVAAEGKVYAPGAFDRLEVDGSAQIRLTQGERDQVVVSGGSDVQDEIEVSLTGNRLHINSTGGWKFWNGARLQIEVQMRQLSRVVLSGNSDLHAPGAIKSDQLTVSISGSGSVRFDDLSVARLRFDISGAGDGQLAGRADNLTLSVSGKGKVLAEQFRVGSTSVSISGVGNASLWVTDSMRVSVSGVGHVEYWGNPSVKRSISGVGSVNARGDKR